MKQITKADKIQAKISKNEMQMRQWRRELQDISEVEEQESMPTESPRKRRVEHNHKSSRDHASRHNKHVLKRIEENHADFQSRFERQQTKARALQSNIQDAYGSSETSSLKSEMMTSFSSIDKRPYEPSKRKNESKSKHIVPSK